MTTHNLFENMVELATAVVNTSSEAGNGHHHSDARKNLASQTNDQLEERFRSLTKDFRPRMLEAAGNLDQAIEEEIKQTYHLLKETGWRPICGYQFDLGRKSNVEAATYRRLGDNALRNGHEADAQAAYTISLSFAHADSTEEAITFSGRSDLWYGARKYESCLLDVNRALKNDRCPPNLKYFLKFRRGECLRRIEKENEQRLDLVNERLTDDGISFIEQYPSVYSGFFIPNYPSKDRTEPRHVDLMQTIPTQTVAISYEPGMGRVLVASRDIEPGEIISKEEYFSMVLKQERALTNCAYCLVKCDALIACPTCVYELYCSEDCREKAFRSYHEFECKIWPYYLYELATEIDDGEFSLAIRSFLVGTMQGAELPNLMLDRKFQDLFPAQISSDIHQRFDGRYATVCHEEAKVELLTATDILKSVKFIRLLRILSFFGDKPANDDGRHTEDLTETEIFAAKLLIKHLTSLKSNSFVVTERISPTPFALEQRCNRIGDGTLGLHSLINHSCDPNVADFTRRRTNFLYALRPIKAGEQMFISYGYCYFDGTSSDRLRQHSSLYGFRCSCHACVNNWPTVTGLKELPTQYLNSDNIAEIENTSRIMWTGANSTSGNVILRPWKIMCDLCKNLHANVAKPSLLIVRCENFIEGCMRHLSNFYVESSGVTEPDE